MFKKSILFLLVSFVFVSSGLFSEDSVSGGDKTLYVIRNVSFHIDGKTRETVLKHYLDIKPGTVLEGDEALQAFLADKLQMIRNQRTIEDGKIDFFFESSSGSPDKVFVDLDVYVKDTWNYLLLPYAKYDSNDGLLMSIRGRNYNFLGSMKKLAWNLDYQLDNSENSEYSLNGGFSLPYYFWGFDWKFSFDEDISVSHDDPLYVYTKAGVSVDIPVDRLVWQASVNQSYYLNEDGDDDEDGYYLKTSGRFGSSIPTGFSIPGVGEVSYSPAVITSYAYKFFDSLSEDRRGYELGAEHSLSAGRIDWIGNFRDGIEFSADQDLRYNFYRDIWLSDSSFELQMHKAFGWGGISSRFMGFYMYNDTEDDLGEPIRGILNDRMSGNAAVYVNLDFPVKMWIWFFDKWFESHISMFFDYALVKPDGGDFSLDDGWYGGGVEGFVFFKSARSIYLRVSVGLDLEALYDGALPGDPAPRDGASIYEIFIGLGHHY